MSVIGGDGEDLEGFRILARCLRHHGVEYMFGVVGIPVMEIAMAAQEVGIHYVGMRNEQSAAYAAQVLKLQPDGEHFASYRAENSLIDVSELHKIRHSADIKAL